MRAFVSKFLSKFNPIVVIMAVVAVVATGTFMFAKTQTAYASCSGQVSYPNTAVIYCGLTGGSANSMALDLKNHYYTPNTDGRTGHEHHDIQTFFNNHGINGSVMSDGKWVMGHIDLPTKHLILNSDSSVVGTVTADYARCYSDGDPYCPSSQNGTIKSTTHIYFGKYGNTMPAIIHLKADGTADFALEAPCANLVVFTPTPPKPKVLTCVQLDMTNEDEFNYTFTATANRDNLAVDNFYFDFGDGHNSEVATNDNGLNGQIKAHVDHTYSADARSQTITIRVYVNKAGQHGTQGVTGENCVKQIPPIGTFSCVQLVARLKHKTSTSRTYSFTAKVQGTEDVDTYQFFFGHSHHTAQQSKKTVSFTYTFDAAHVHSFKAYFIAKSTEGHQTDKHDANCAFKFSTTTTLVRTGPGGFGIVALASALGVGLYQFVLRRRLA